MIHKRFDFSQLGGFPLTTDQVLAYMQEAYSDLAEVIKGIWGGGNAILSGVDRVGTQVTDGWILYSGEILPFKGGTSTLYFEIKEESTAFRFEDGQDKTVRFFRYAQPTPTTNPNRISMPTIRIGHTPTEWVDCENISPSIEVLQPVQCRINTRGKGELKGQYRRNTMPSMLVEYDFNIPAQFQPTSNQMRMAQTAILGGVAFPSHILHDTRVRIAWTEDMIGTAFYINCEFDL